MASAGDGWSRLAMTEPGDGDPKSKPKARKPQQRTTNDGAPKTTRRKPARETGPPNETPPRRGFGIRSDDAPTERPRKAPAGPPKHGGRRPPDGDRRRPPGPAPSAQY